jgi:hypothetical protein
MGLRIDAEELEEEDPPCCHSDKLLKTGLVALRVTMAYQNQTERTSSFTKSRAHN